MTQERAVALDLLTSAASSFRGVLAEQAVAESWASPSACAGYTVGGLAAHVVVAVGWVRSLVDAPPPVRVPVLTLGRQFAEVGDRGRRLDDPQHAALRSGAETASAAGHAATLERFDRAVQRATSCLRDEDLDRLVDLRPVDDAAVRLGDVLRTRVLELVVHADDLATSCGTELSLEPHVVDDVMRTLLEIARARSGDLRVLRALARGERAGAAGVFPCL
jgi:uncharacterized protein (TIGR03083 family)